MTFAINILLHMKHGIAGARLRCRSKPFLGDERAAPVMINGSDTAANLPHDGSKSRNRRRRFVKAPPPRGIRLKAMWNRWEMENFRLLLLRRNYNSIRMIRVPEAVSEAIRYGNAA